MKVRHGNMFRRSIRDQKYWVRTLLSDNCRKNTTSIRELKGQLILVQYPTANESFVRSSPASE